jgi:hypothetical protein
MRGSASAGLVVAAADTAEGTAPTPCCLKPQVASAICCSADCCHGHRLHVSTRTTDSTSTEATQDAANFGVASAGSLFVQQRNRRRMTHRVADPWQGAGPVPRAPDIMARLQGAVRHEGHGLQVGGQWWRRPVGPRPEPRLPASLSTAATPAAARACDDSRDTMRSARSRGGTRGTRA